MKLSLHLLIYVVFLSAISTFAQSARERGFESYKKGEYESAIQYLETIIKVNSRSLKTRKTLN